MSGGFNRRRFIALAAVIALAGCALSRAARKEPGLDISPVKPGATRREIEAVVGAPEREWTTRTGVRYGLYHYDAGIQDTAGPTAGVLFMDLATLGLFEAISAYDDSDSLDFRGPRRTALLAVSYDAQGVALGVFRDIGELDVLPEDGRPK